MRDEVENINGVLTSAYFCRVWLVADGPGAHHRFPHRRQNPMSGAAVLVWDSPVHRNGLPESEKFDENLKARAESWKTGVVVVLASWHF